MRLIRRTFLALALIAGFSPAIAQQFPTVPAQTVIGRLGIPGDTGPSQAVPFAKFFPGGHIPSETCLASDAKSDAIQVTSATTITLGSPNLAVAGMSFVAADKGKSIVIPGAGAGTASAENQVPLISTILAVVDGQHVVLSSNAGSGLVAAVIPVTYGTDSTAAVQKQLNSGSVCFAGGGSKYLIVGDLQIPSNRLIWFQTNSTLYFANHITSNNTVNVSLQIDGYLNWLGTNRVTTIWNSPNERGAIEFGSSLVAPTSGYHIFGTGKVCGNWPGTIPNFNQGDPFQVERKGIAIFNAGNTVVEDIEVCGFDGEAVYFLGADNRTKNVQFRNLYVHNSRFNGINFNVPGQSAPTANSNEGMFIIDNYIYNTFTGIEASTGVISRNVISSTLFSGILWGFGSGTGVITVTNNVVQYVNGVAYWLKFDPAASPAAFDSIVTGNYCYGPGSSCFIVANVGRLLFDGNVAAAWGAATAGASPFPASQYAFDIQNVSSGTYGTNSSFAAGAFSAGTLFTASATMQFTTPQTAGTTGQVAVFQTGAVPINVNGTISGISLGSNLNALTFGTHLASGGSSYNGSANVTITSDATAVNTASTIMARDGSGQVAATTFTGNLAGNATTSTTTTSATNATNTAITDDTATNATVYPTWVTANTGNLPQKVTSTKLSFNPSTGMLTATGFTGPLTGHASLDLALTGGTMSGAIAMGSNNITGIANAAATTFNGNTFTTGTGTLTLAAGKTLTDTSGVGASILLGATGGGFAAYGGASACSSNNFVTALSAAGASTCGTLAAGSVTNAMLAGSIAASKLVGTDITTVGTITAGTWTGTTVAVANGGTGDTGTAWTTAGAPTCKDGAGVVFNTYTSSWRYKTLGKTVWFTLTCLVTNISGATNGNLFISLPVTAATTSANTSFFATGWNNVGGTLIFGQIASAGTAITVSYVSGTPAASGSITFAAPANFQISGTYESN